MANEDFDNQFQAYKTLMDTLYSSVSEKTGDDKTFRRETTTQIQKRDKQYTDLLNHFVRITRIRNKLKEFFKWAFLIIIIVALIVLIKITVSIFRKYLDSATIEQMGEAIPLLMTSMIGFISVIISIPVIVTKYLFSTKEDENITQIILHTQEHDVSGRKWAMDYKGLVEKSNVKEGKTFDVDEKIPKIK